MVLNEQKRRSCSGVVLRMIVIIAWWVLLCFAGGPLSATVGIILAVLAVVAIFPSYLWRRSTY